MGPGSAAHHAASAAQCAASGARALSIQLPPALGHRIEKREAGDLFHCAIAA
jgi:hypothetical protein